MTIREHVASIILIHPNVIPNHEEIAEFLLRLRNTGSRLAPYFERQKLCSMIITPDLTCSYSHRKLDISTHSQVGHGEYRFQQRIWQTKDQYEVILRSIPRFILDCTRNLAGVSLQGLTTRLSDNLLVYPPVSVEKLPMEASGNLSNSSSTSIQLSADSFKANPKANVDTKKPWKTKKSQPVQKKAKSGFGSTVEVSKSIEPVRPVESASYGQIQEKFDSNRLTADAISAASANTALKKLLKRG